jgi:hypothetical protein
MCWATFTSAAIVVWYGFVGHLYVIGECRLPMSMGRCPQCGVSIGGEHHTMLR